MIINKNFIELQCEFGETTTFVQICDIVGFRKSVAFDNRVVVFLRRNTEFKPDINNTNSISYYFNGSIDEFIEYLHKTTGNGDMLNVTKLGDR